MTLFYAWLEPLIDVINQFVKVMVVFHTYMELFGPAKSILFFDIEFHLYCFVCSIFSCFRFVGFQGKVELNQWEEKLMLTFCNNVLGALFLVAT